MSRKVTNLVFFFSICCIYSLRNVLFVEFTNTVQRCQREGGGRRGRSLAGMDGHGLMCYSL